MLTLENVSVNKTARKEELLAYIIFKDFIFGEKECVIGDSNCDNSTDIYAKDFSVGAEVVICETAETFQKIQKRRTGNLFDNVPQRKSKKFLYKNGKKYLNTEYKNYLSEEDEYYYNLENLLTQKIINQTKNHYSVCKEMNLIVMSCFMDKKYVKDEEIFYYCRTLMEMYESSYKAIYFALGDRILMVDNQYNCKIISDLRRKINDNEIEK